MRRLSAAQEAASLGEDLSSSGPTLKEATAWVRLDRHPNVTQAFFLERVLGRLQQFLEYVGGGDLRHWIGAASGADRPRRRIRSATAFRTSPAAGF